MKIKFIIFFVLSNFCFTSFAQTTNSILYKSDHWADTKGKGGFAKAMENPTYQKVEILKTDKNFKVTFGTKVYNYTIISSKIFSEFKTDYTVTLNDKNYILSIVLMPNGKTSIGIEGNWMVADTQDIPSNNNDKVVLKFCKVLENEKSDGNQYISPMLYKAVQKIYPGTSLEFYNAKCKNLYQDKKILNEIFVYFFDMGSSQNTMAFIQLGMSATDAEILSNYIDTKPFNK